MTEKGCVTEQQRKFHQTPSGEEPSFQGGPHKSLVAMLSTIVREDEQSVQADTW